MILWEIKGNNQKEKKKALTKKEHVKLEKVKYVLINIVSNAGYKVNSFFIREK